MRILTAFVILFMVIGCANTLPVPEKYRPVETLSDRPFWISFLDEENMATTIGTTVYVKDAKDWQTARPIDGIRYDAVMQHERVHSYRQLRIGLTTWLSKYGSSSKFRWQEESLGWYIQLRIYFNKGVIIIPEDIAKTLSQYRPFLISYKDALIWVREVWSGRWKPDANKDLPEDLRKQ